MYLVFVLNKEYLKDEKIGYDFDKGVFIQINHKDSNKLNNHYSNLELTSLQENISHAVKYKLHNSQINAKYDEIYKNSKLLITVWKTRGASKWLFENYNIKINCGTISRYARNGKKYRDFSFKYKV